MMMALRLSSPRANGCYQAVYLPIFCVPVVSNTFCRHEIVYIPQVRIARRRIVLPYVSFLIWLAWIISCSGPQLCWKQTLSVFCSRYVFVLVHNSCFWYCLQGRIVQVYETATAWKMAGCPFLQLIGSHKAWYCPQPAWHVNRRIYQISALSIREFNPNYHAG